jgi:hypothetical protein
MLGMPLRATPALNLFKLKEGTAGKRQIDDKDVIFK